MIPILFEYDATTYTTHGLGDLVDCLSCETAQTEEGEYELALEYPMGSPMFGELIINRLVVAKPNPYDSPQAFRIYGYEKELNGVMRVKCQHISYDITNIPVKAFKDKTTASSALSTMKSNAVMTCPFIFSTDIPSSTKPHTRDEKFKVEIPDRMRTILLDGDSSIRGSFGGDLIFDNFNITLKETGGMDRGVIIEYGVDLVDMNQEENISEMVTGVYPYFRYTLDDDDNTEAIAYGTVQYASGTFQKHNIQPLDLTEYFPNQEEHSYPSQSQLNSKAQEWIASEKIGQPVINITLTPAALGQDIRLYDSVTVRFLKMGINDLKAKVTSYKYDVLKERYEDVEIGYAKPSILFSLEDASHLKRGLLPPERIKDKSLTSEKYSDGSVGSKSIAEEAISSYHLVDSAITSGKLSPGSVTATALHSDAVTSDAIKNDAVTSDKINSGAVTGAKIASGAVKSTNIDANAVTSDKINSGAVTGAKIASGAVTSSKIEDGAVITSKLDDDSVTAGKVKSYSIDFYHIADGAIITDKIDSEAVTGNKILDEAVSYYKTSYGVQDTLDTVGINYSEIAAIQALFANTLSCNHLEIDGGLYYHGNYCSTVAVPVSGVRYNCIYVGTS